MRRNSSLILIIIACAAFLAACAGKGEKLAVIELEGNPTTGYSWTYTMSPEGIVRESARGHREKPGDDGGVTGKSFLFVFEAFAPGETELRFTYRRPWENEEPVRTAVYILKAHQNGTITVREF